jgi:glycosyltransferase involved in cell wall biosynthesis
MNPRISIVMPVWNGETYLREAVDSILAQTFIDFELVAVDDGSTDASVSILGSYGDERIRIIRQGRGGFVKAVNRGVAEARAAWIARHDADDVSHPQRLQKQWEAIQRRPSAVFCHIGVEGFGEQGLTGRQPRLPRSRALAALKGCFHCPVCVGAGLMKRSSFLEAGGYREEEFPAEDYAFISRILTLGNVVGVPRTLYKIRKHDRQISHVKLEAQKQKTRMIALENCRQFMRLPVQDAERAHAVLVAPLGERKWADWWWFLTCCAPRLRWKSAETRGWLAWQSLKIWF